MKISDHDGFAYFCCREEAPIKSWSDGIATHNVDGLKWPLWTRVHEFETILHSVSSVSHDSKIFKNLQSVASQVLWSESIGSGIWWSSYELYMIISDLWSSIYQDLYMIFIYVLLLIPIPIAQAVRVVEAVCSQDQARGSWQCSAFAPLVCRGADERSRSPRWQVCVCAVCDVCDVRIDIVLKMWDNVR
jgi:hypothetical protein